MKAQTEEDAKSGNSATEARRWTGVRTIVEARSLLKTLFRAAAGHKAQVRPINSLAWARCSAHDTFGRFLWQGPFILGSPYLNAVSSCLGGYNGQCLLSNRHSQQRQCVSHHA